MSLEASEGYPFKQAVRDTVEVMAKSAVTTLLTFPLEGPFRDSLTKIPSIMMMGVIAGGIDRFSKVVNGNRIEPQRRLVEDMKSFLVGLNVPLGYLISHSPLTPETLATSIGGLILAEGSIILGAGKLGAMEARGAGRDLRG